MDVLVGTSHSFILGPDLLLFLNRTGVSQSMVAEVRFTPTNFSSVLNSTQDDRCFQYWGRRCF